MFSKEKITEYKKVLEDAEKEVRKQIAMEEHAENFGDDVDGFDEETDEAEDLGNRLAAGHVLRTRLDEIAQALQRIEGGAYGVCTNCRKEIEEKILKVAPESELCKNCKQKK